MLRMPRWPPRSQNWRIVEGKVIFPATAGTEMRWGVKVELMHTVLADSRSYLVGRETRNIAIEGLDFLKQSLPDASTRETAEREGGADCFAGAVEADDDDREFLFLGEVLVEALEEMIHGQDAAKHASTASALCHGLLLLPSLLVWPPPLPPRYSPLVSSLHRYVLPLPPPTASYSQPGRFDIGLFLQESSPYAWGATGIGLCLGLSVAGAGW
jgi:hypothetical protein